MARAQRPMPGCDMNQATALQEARWHVNGERSWRGVVLLRNAERVLKAPEGHREASLATAIKRTRSEGNAGFDLSTPGVPRAKQKDRCGYCGHSDKGCPRR